jgi:mannose-6-phosphate isomerase
MLYPLKFRPIFKNYIWGGRRLADLGKVLPDQGVVAESWEISCHPNGPSVIANGVLAGMPLPEATGRFGRLLLGQSLPDQSIRQFPLLVKFIDANDWLSVQVHPDDRFATLHESGEAGKSEMWYMIAAEPGASLIAGIRPDVGRDDLAAALASDACLDLFQKVAVKAGDVVNIPAGLVHAAGQGLLICEVQQSSDVTYRLYDYQRRDPQGQSRPLHLAKGLAAIDFKMTGKMAKRGLAISQGGLSSRILVLNRYFLVEELTLRGEAEFTSDGSRFMTLTAVSGQGEIRYHDEANLSAGPFARWTATSLRQGESVLIPACLGDWRLAGDLTLITSQVSDFTSDFAEIAALSGQCLENAGQFSSLIEQWSGLIGFEPLPENFTRGGGGGG